MHEKEAEKKSDKVCKMITKRVERIVHSKGKVSSDEIFRLLVKELRKLDKDAAFLYETHRDIS